MKKAQKAGSVTQVKPSEELRKMVEEKMHQNAALQKIIQELKNPPKNSTKNHEL
jgi:hypothetical protein